MILVLNFVLSVVIFIVVNLMGGLCLQGKTGSRAIASACWLFCSPGRAMLIHELSYLYALVACVAWLGQADASLLAFVSLVGLAGAIAVPVDVYLNFRRREMPSPQTGRYIFQVTSDYRTRTQEETSETVENLKRKSASDVDAEDALRRLANRQDDVGEFVRRIVGPDIEDCAD